MSETECGKRGRGQYENKRERQSRGERSETVRRDRESRVRGDI